MVASMPAQFAPGIAGAVGYVLPGNMVEIIGDDGRAAPAGVKGVVRIKSEFGVREYLDDPEETKRVFRDGWFHPGYLGYLTEDNMLVFSGRSSEVKDQDVADTLDEP